MNLLDYRSRLAGLRGLAVVLVIFYDNLIRCSEGLSLCLKWL